MDTSIVQRNNFEVTALTEEEAYGVMEFGHEIGIDTEMDGLLKNEMGIVTVNAALSLMEVRQAAHNLSKELLDRGIYTKGFAETMQKLENIHGQNILAVTHATHQVQMQKTFHIVERE